jgi:nitrite reductase/ring-hydroxylating ferredoxin subunit
MKQPHDSVDACDACEAGVSRRWFIERSSVIAASALLSLGVPRDLLAQMRPAMIVATGRRGNVIDYPVPAADGVQIDRTNEVILTRWQGSIIAFNLACPHQRAPLRWSAEDSRFECPKHHSHYSPDGTYISGRATRSMDRLGISRTADVIHVDLDVLIKEPDQPGPWKAAQLAVS